MNGTEWEKERSVLWGRMGVGERDFYMPLHYEILVSLQKRFKLILCAVSSLEVLKIFVVPKPYLKFSFVTVGAGNLVQCLLIDIPSL